MVNSAQKMTSARKNDLLTLRKGVSLFEVVIALFLIGLLASFGLIAFNTKSNSQALEESRVEIEAMSSKARTLAFLKQTPYRITLESSKTIKLERPGSESSGFEVLSTYNSEVDISLRRWGAKENQWEVGSRADDKVIHWYFSPTGLCEPVSIRLQDDESWIVMHMDALTGRIQDEDSLIK